MAEELTLEKLKIDERLRSVEEHMTEAKITNTNLIKGFEDMKESVTKLEHIVFGNGEKGVVHKLDDLVAMAAQVRGVLKRIFWTIAGVLLIAAIPSLTKFLHDITHATTG